jgi:UDP-N-acetylmuramate--alanine ligase
MHIYFVGIGGAGLSPMAQLALDCGYEVSGSDVSHGHGTNAVENRGVKVHYSQDGLEMALTHAQNPIDWVVYTAACKPYHDELVFAQTNDIKLTKRDGFINFVLKEKNLKLIGVAGTHGKTTTTGMMVWCFKQLGIPVSYLVGSNLSFGPSASYEAGSEYFILEADEFDRNFLRFEPEYSLITNIDYDHPDVYHTEKNYYEAFEQYCIQNNKEVFLWKNDFEKLEFTSLTNNSPNTICLDYDDKKTATLISSIQLNGLHNRQNAFLCFKLMEELFQILTVEELSSFPGTQRRMEELFPKIYSDYAHHPTEIKATLQLASELCKKIVVVYQPHQNARQVEVIDLYQDCFDKVSKVYWLPTYLSREDPSVRVLTPEELIKAIPINDHIVHAEMTIDLQHQLSQDYQDGFMILAMGAGDIDTWLRAVSKIVYQESTTSLLKSTL